MLGTTVRRRRITLGMSISKAAREAGISRATWTAVEDGSRETEPYNYGLVEKVLGWAPGSIEAVLAGGEPTELDGYETPGSTDSETAAGNADRVIAAIVEVLNSSISGSTKLRLIEGLIANDYRPARPVRSEDVGPGQAAAG